MFVCVSQGLPEDDNGRIQSDSLLAIFMDLPIFALVGLKLSLTLYSTKILSNHWYKMTWYTRIDIVL